MGNTLLVLTGSPRVGGNSDLLADSFIRGAEGAGATVLRFDAGRASIRGCTACDGCWSTGTPCVVQDDLLRLAPLLETADTLALVSPLYFFSFPAQLKAALDKLYPYVPKRTRVPLKIKESFLLMCAGDHEEAVFEGALGTYRQVVRYQGWRDRGILLAPGMGEKGVIAATDFPARAEALGQTASTAPK